MFYRLIITAFCIVVAIPGASVGQSIADLESNRLQDHDNPSADTRIKKGPPTTTCEGELEGRYRFYGEAGFSMGTLVLRRNGTVVPQRGRRLKFRGTVMGGRPVGGRLVKRDPLSDRRGLNRCWVEGSIVLSRGPGNQITIQIIEAFPHGQDGWEGMAMDSTGIPRTFSLPRY